MGRGITVLADARGHAFVETVIVLPALLALWVGVTHIAQTFERGQSLGSEARQRAWAHVLEGCVDPPPPETVVLEVTEAGPDPLASRGRSLPLVAGDWPDRWPVELAYERAGGVNRPVLIDPAQRPNDVRRRSVLMCNEVPRSSPLGVYARDGWERWGVDGPT
jgi:hypothetical protein